MAKYADPKILGLNSRTKVELIDKSTYAIVINRKSRIIMADGRKILVNAEKIKQAKPDVRVLLKTSAPVCSKTLQFLADHGIGVIEEFKKSPKPEKGTDFKSVPPSETI